MVKLFQGLEFLHYEAGSSDIRARTNCQGRLSVTETIIISDLALGLSLEEIASKRDLTTQNVRVHIRNASRKTALTQDELPMILTEFPQLLADRHKTELREEFLKQRARDVCLLPTPRKGRGPQIRRKQG